ncbi:hypothetical protein [Streptomyces lutosisoli]|uniref:DUF1127 domain-containing protein n=1 Tax=Streptomyces lutosisoli TaxID=2665721 RepID=A0ABW2VSC7_9ACTN
MADHAFSAVSELSQGCRRGETGAAIRLNHHDLRTLEGVGIREEQQPMILRIA